MQKIRILLLKQQALKFHAWFGGQSPFIFVLVALALSYLVLIPQIVIVEVLGSNSPLGGRTFNSLERALFEAVIFAPLLETLLNQKFTYWILRDKLHWSRVIYVVVSAAIFGALHTYSLQYVLFGFLAGLVLGYGYLVARKNGRQAYWLVATVHALHNGIAVTLVFLTK